MPTVRGLACFLLLVPHRRDVRTIGVASGARITAFSSQLPLDNKTKRMSMPSLIVRRTQGGLRCTGSIPAVVRLSFKRQSRSLPLFLSQQYLLPISSTRQPSLRGRIQKAKNTTNTSALSIQAIVLTDTVPSGACISVVYRTPKSSSDATLLEQIQKQTLENPVEYPRSVLLRIQYPAGRG